MEVRFGLLLILSTILIPPCQPEQLLRKRRQPIPNIVLVGAIFDSSDRNSPEYTAFNLKSSGKSFSNADDNIIKTKVVYVDDISDSFQMAGAICQLLVSEVIAVFGPIHPRTVHTIQSLTDANRLIYITYSDAHHYASESTNERFGKNIIKLRPLVANAVVDFIHSENWQRILYLYDSNEALFRLRMIFEHTNSRRIDLSADARQYSFSQSDGVLQYINRKSKRNSQKHIILDLKGEESKNRIIQQMDELKRDRVDYHYLVTEMDAREIKSSFIINGGMNFTIFSPLDYNNPVLNEFMKSQWLTENNKKPYQSSTSNSQRLQKLPYEAALIVDGLELLKRALKVAVKSTRFHTNSGDQVCSPVTNPKYCADELKPAITRIKFMGLTGNVQFNESGFRHHYKIDIIEARVKESLKTIGNWSTSYGLKSIPRNKSDFTLVNFSKNRTLRVSSILVPPFLMRVKDKNGKDTDEFEGFCKDLVNEIAKMLNFTYKIFQVKDEQFGALVNDSWNGMIGELMRNEADLVVAPLTITSSRERVVDFSTPFMEFGLSVMYLKPDDREPEAFGFMKPLSKDIWMCITFAYLGVSVVLFLVSRFNPYEWGVDTPVEADSKVSNEFTIFNSFWFSLSAFMQQGGDISPRSLAGRIVGGVWWFFTLIIVSSYTANLAAYLTVERMNNPIKSYEDLAKQNKIRYGVVNSGSSKEFFSNSRIEIFQKMWQYMESNPDVFVSNITIGYEKVKYSKGEYAFILESSMNEYYNQLKPCTTTKIGPNLDSGKGYGIATPPGSNYRDSINLAVLELKEKNRIPEFYEFWWKNKSQCLDFVKSESDISQTSVKLRDIRGLFYLLTGGLALGLMLSVFELFYKCALESRRKNKRFWSVFRIMMHHSVDKTQMNSEIIEPCVPLREEEIKPKVEYSF